MTAFNKIFIICLVSGLAACSRSQSYRPDGDYDAESPQSYFNRRGPTQNPTERVSLMGQPKKRVVVFDFWNDTPVKDNTLGSFAADEIRRMLFQSQRVILPMDLKASLATKDFIDGSSVRVAQLMREGRRSGASVIIIGRISKLVFRQRGDEVGFLSQIQSLGAADVEVKLFDVQSGRELISLGRSGEASSNNVVVAEHEDLATREYRSELAKLSIRQATSQVTSDLLKIIDKLSWQGKIAKIVGTKIYLNSGRASGLLAGDILKVLAIGDDVYDPETGSLLGRTDGHVKGTVEISDFIGDDAAVANVHSGAQFQEGDLVRLY